MKKKVIGIIGGLGPEATLELFRLILIHTPAKVDQDHIHIFIDNNTDIPDPNDAVMVPGTPDSAPQLCHSAQILEQSGADLLILPCNTAHIFLDPIQKAVKIPILSIVDAAIQELIQEKPDIHCVGLLASPAVVHKRLYAQPLAKRNISTLDLIEEERTLLHEVIFSIKAGIKDEQVKNRLKQLANRLIQDGAEAIILACTELPLVLHPGDLPVPMINTTEALAKSAVRQALSL